MTQAQVGGRAHPGPSPRPVAETTPPVVLLIGNPNVGKTSLFNLLAGRRERVGNYPGVTVERRSAVLPLPEGGRAEVVDIPGCYSLSARSAEEQLAVAAALGWGEHPRPALCIVVLDAGQVLRNSYLLLQLMELRIPCVVALNLVDEAGANAPSADELARCLGVPCVVTNGRVGEGRAELLQSIERALAAPPVPGPEIAYPPALLPDVDRVAEALPSEWRGSVERSRALALWALLSVEEDDELEGIEPVLRQACRDVHERAPERDIDQEVIRARYAHLERRLADVSRSDSRASSLSRTDRVDKILLHPVFGFAAFLGIMTALFQTLFTGADPLIGLVESVVFAVQGLAMSVLPPGLLQGLVADGIVGGVGNVLVFLPQIALLFLFVGLLEDSGYMARVAYLMDRAMRAVGLHGRAFVPMMSGFACAVPAIVATRTMERSRDRLLTMLVVPLMSCSARLPVYTLIIAALFPPSLAFGVVPVQGLLLVGIYLFSTLIALAAAAVLGRTAVRGRRVPLILELPPYRVPTFKTVLRMVSSRSKLFIKEAGTTILGFTLIMWALLSFPRVPDTQATNTPAPSDEVVLVAPPIGDSYGGTLGKWLEPSIAPLGFDWKIGVGIVGAFAAREVFVSTLGLVFGVDEADEASVPLREQIQNEKAADGSPAYSPLMGLSLMVFFALACQCMSTLAVVRRETRSWRWPGFLFVYMTALAWIFSFAVFQGGRLLGFG